MTRWAVPLLLTLISACGSDDGWLDPGLPAGSSAPHLAMTPDGAAVLSYLAPDEAGTRLGFVVLRGDVWSEPQQVAAGQSWFVNWANVPSVVPISADLWAAHWLRRSGTAPYAYDAVVATSRDAGRSWSPGITIHSDSAPTEHGFVSLFPAPEGVGAVWLDGRQLTSEPEGTMQLMSAVLRVPGGTVVEEQVVDTRVCDCCQTDVAMTDQSPAVVYRDRSPEDVRDVAFSRLRSGVWEPGRTVGKDGWRIRGCPVNGPAVAANGSRVAVAWYTAHPERRVQVAFSRDGGETFSVPVDVHAEAPLGRVDVVLLDTGGAVVSWLDALPGRLNCRQVAADGSLGPPRVVADLSPERNTGFPQMIRLADSLLFAWTDVQTNGIRTRRLPLTP